MPKSSDAMYLRTSQSNNYRESNLNSRSSTSPIRATKDSTKKRSENINTSRVTTNLLNVELLKLDAYLREAPQIHHQSLRKSTSQSSLYMSDMRYIHNNFTLLIRLQTPPQCTETTRTETLNCRKPLHQNR